VSETHEVEIAGLPSLNLAQLQVKWRRALKVAQPHHLKKSHSWYHCWPTSCRSRPTAVRSREVKRRLQELTASFHWDPKETTARRADPLWIKPGTM